MFGLFIGIVKTKLYSLMNNKICLSAMLINCKIDKTAAIRQRSRIYNSELGRYSYIARECLIQNTSMGSFCSISERCSIGMPSHPTQFVSTSPVFLQGRNYLKFNFAKEPYNNEKKTHIGNDVWIGYGAMIKDGVYIGDGAIVAAGAVVSKNVEPYAIVGGIPAKLIKYRFDEKTIKELEEKQWWKYSEQKLKMESRTFISVEKFLEGEKL